MPNELARTEKKAMRVFIVCCLLIFFLPTQKKRSKGGGGPRWDWLRRPKKSA